MKMNINSRFDIPEIHQFLVNLKEVITEESTVLWDSSSDLEDDRPENVSHLLLSFQASMKELVLLRQRSQDEPGIVMLIEEILSELLFQDIEFISFSKNLTYLISFVLLNELESKASHLIGVVIMGILKRITTHSFQPSPTKFANLRVLLRTVEEVGVVDIQQFSQYRKSLLVMFQRESLPYPGLHDNMDVMSMNATEELSESERVTQKESLTNCVASILGCSVSVTEDTALSTYEEHKTLLFTESLMENVSVMDTVVPVVKLLSQLDSSSLYDSCFCDCVMVIMIRKLYFETSQCKKDNAHMDQGLITIKSLLSIIHLILPLTVSSLSQYSYLLYSYLIGIRECFTLMDGYSEDMGLVTILKDEIIFIIDSIAHESSLPQYITSSAVESFILSNI